MTQAERENIKKLADEAIFDDHGCLTSACPHLRQKECFRAIWIQGYEDGIADLEGRVKELEENQALLCKEARDGDAENAKLREALEVSRDHCSMDDPEFGNFTPLQFAARLGLIYSACKEALRTPSSDGGENEA